MELKSIVASELIDAQARGITPDIIDVRTPAEYAALHVRGARSLPLTTLDAAALATERSTHRDPLYVICHTGTRARKACERLAASGLRNVVVIEGGTVAWERTGGPVVRGRSVMSLERQVRIAAGTLVLIGSVLAMTVTPWFLLLSAFVGAGLVVSGLTDTCGMGLILARMPWNQVGSGESCTPPQPSSAQ